MHRVSFVVAICIFGGKEEVALPLNWCNIKTAAVIFDENYTCHISVVGYVDMKDCCCMGEHNYRCCCGSREDYLRWVLLHSSLFLYNFIELFIS